MNDKIINGIIAKAIRARLLKLIFIFRLTLNTVNCNIIKVTNIPSTARIGIPKLTSTKDNNSLGEAIVLNFENVINLFRS